MATVSNANRKSCAQCGADVTFAPRVRLANGTYLCQACSDLAAKATEKDCVALLCETGGVPLTELQISADTQHGINCDPPIAPGGSTSQQMDHLPPRSPKQFVMTPARWAILGAALGTTVIAVSTYFILRLSWEQANFESIEALRMEGYRLLGGGKPKEGYAKFQELFSFIGDHPIQDSYLREHLADSKQAMERAYSLAKPIIDREAAEKKAQVEAQQREERERIVRESAARQRQEQLRREHETARTEQLRIEREQARRRAREALGQDAFRKSQQYAALVRAANEVVSDLETQLIAEDSAYRTLSRRAGASRDLLAIYVKLQGHLVGTDVTAEVDRTLRASEIRLTGEDSAIRAIYMKDQAFFELVGIWCNVLSKQDSKLPSKFNSLRSDAARDTALDDSAPRAISRYAGASMLMLQEILSSRGQGQKAAEIVVAVIKANGNEDSTWREAMRNAEANMDLFLLLLNRNNDGNVRKIRSGVHLSTIGDDSALRIQSECRQGIIDTLHLLITEP